MNGDGFFRALGVADPGSAGGLPLVRIEGQPVTMAGRATADALAVAARRATPLVVVERSDGAPASDGGPRPWPLVVVAESPWALARADFGLLVGQRGPADHDGLDEVAAASLVAQFLTLSADGPAVPPLSSRSLLDVVPYDIDGVYEVEEVLAALVDGSRWVELDAGGAREVLTVVARIGGRPLGIAASRPGVGQGRLGPDGCARVERLVEWCERGRRPFLSLVDSAGALAATDGADQERMVRAASRVRRAEVTKLAVVTGRAVGLAATVLGAVGARADVVLPWPRARFALGPPPSGLAPAEADRLASVDRAATEGDVPDVIHPDESRSRIVELLDLLRGRREHTP